MRQLAGPIGSALGPRPIRPDPHPTDREATEQILAELARSGSPDGIGKLGDRILAHLNPDGRLTDANHRARMRGITVGRQQPDGMSPVRGEIDPVLL
ncbi:DUF222 domain-containing protein [Nocardia sp. CA-129566]|uniref:DUF222 domain-containing protein n=1 Tax=Nocardia sp. CA-129566 TaxID=3239976 RepID=UPI003D9642D0